MNNKTPYSIMENIILPQVKGEKGNEANKIN